MILESQLRQIKEGFEVGSVIFPEWNTWGRDTVINTYWNPCDQFALKFENGVSSLPVLALNCCDGEHFLINADSWFYLWSILPILNDWRCDGPCPRWAPESPFKGITNGEPFIRFLYRCAEVVSQKAVMDLPMDE